MQYVPYKISHGTSFATHFTNDYKMLMTLQTEEDANEYIKAQAVEYVKFEDGGKKAQDCVCNSATIGGMRDGNLVYVGDDGSVTVIEKVSGTLYGYTTTPKIHFRFDAIGTKEKSIQRPVINTVDEAVRATGYDAVIQELKEHGRNRLKPIPVKQRSPDVEMPEADFPELPEFVVPEAPEVPQKFIDEIRLLIARTELGCNKGKSIYDSMDERIACNTSESVSSDSSDSDDEITPPGFGKWVSATPNETQFSFRPKARSWIEEIEADEPVNLDFVDNKVRRVGGQFDWFNKKYGR